MLVVHRRETGFREGKLPAQLLRLEFVGGETKIKIQRNVPIPKYRIRWFYYWTKKYLSSLQVAAFLHSLYGINAIVLIHYLAFSKQWADTQFVPTLSTLMTYLLTRLTLTPAYALPGPPWSWVSYLSHPSTCLSEVRVTHTPPILV